MLPFSLAAQAVLSVRVPSLLPLVGVSRVLLAQQTVEMVMRLALDLFQCKSCTKCPVHAVLDTDLSECVTWVRGKDFMKTNLTSQKALFDRSKRSLVKPRAMRCVA